MAFNPVSRNSKTKITSAFEFAHNSCTPKERRTARAAAPTPPSAKSFVTLTGSVTLAVKMKIETKPEPIPSTRAIVLSAI